MARNLSPLEILAALIENEIDYLEPEELAQTIIDAGFISIYDNEIGRASCRERV